MVEPFNERDTYKTAQHHHNIITNEPKISVAVDDVWSIQDVEVKVRQRVHKTRAFLIDYRRELLIGVTTVLLTSQALLHSKITTKKPHTGSVSMAISLIFELTKLFFSLILFGLNLHKGSVNFSFRESSLYAIPAFIYLINDNLVFVIFDIIKEPTTFEILANMRIIFTAILFRLVFKRPLHKIQWVALMLLCIGSATSQLVTCGDNLIVNVPAKGFFLVLIYSLLSGCAGIYTEYLMKLRVNDSFYFQNVQMYLWGTILNATVMIVFYNSDLRDIGLFELAIGRDYLTLLIVLNHALCGLSIAALIRFTDNIARVYSHAIGMAMTMTISSIFFWDLPSIQLVFGICIVSISIYLFYTDLEPHWTSSESPRRRESLDYHHKNSALVDY